MALVALPGRLGLDVQLGGDLMENLAGIRVHGRENEAAERKVLARCYLDVRTVRPGGH